MKKCIVLGNGPAGLLAAHAAQLKGWLVEIVAQQVQPSIISGAQYLDRSIPDVTSEIPDDHVIFHKKGNGQAYAEKIYGSPDSQTSWSSYDDGRSYPMWFLKDAYERLWNVFEGQMSEVTVDANYMSGLMDTDYHLIVSTIPLRALCYRGHIFQSQDVTIASGLPDRLGKKWIHLREDTDPWILYNGKQRDPWYRASSIGGHQSTEYPGHDGSIQGRYLIKPLHTNCSCWEGSPRVILAGRYGKWEKRQLVSHAFEAVNNAV